MRDDRIEETPVDTGPRVVERVVYVEAKPKKGFFHGCSWVLLALGILIAVPFAWTANREPPSAPDPWAQIWRPDVGSTWLDPTDEEGTVHTVVRVWRKEADRGVLGIKRAYLVRIEPRTRYGLVEFYARHLLEKFQPE